MCPMEHICDHYIISQVRLCHLYYNPGQRVMKTWTTFTRRTIIDALFDEFKEVLRQNKNQMDLTCA